MDELCITPLSQWRKLLKNPPRDDFFYIEPEGPVYYPANYPITRLEREIARIFREPSNQALVRKAGLGDPDQLKALMPAGTNWIFIPTESGILIFEGLAGEGHGLAVALIPSLEAIYKDGE